MIGELNEPYPSIETNEKQNEEHHLERGLHEEKTARETVVVGDDVVNIGIVRVGDVDDDADDHDQGFEEKVEMHEGGDGEQCELNE